MGKIRSVAESGAGIGAAQSREEVLVTRNAATSNADAQLQAVLRGAHETAAQYSRRLTAIERAIDEAVARQSSLALDTPAGARQFQQFLAGKHAQIMAVVADAQRSDTEQSAQMTVLAAQYKTSTGWDDDPLDEAEQLAPPGWSMDHHGNWSPPVIHVEGGAAGGGSGRAPI